MKLIFQKNPKTNHKQLFSNVITLNYLSRKFNVLKLIKKTENCIRNNYRELIEREELTHRGLRWPPAVRDITIQVFPQPLLVGLIAPEQRVSEAVVEHEELVVHYELAAVIRLMLISFKNNNIINN